MIRPLSVMDNLMIDHEAVKATRSCRAQLSHFLFFLVTGRCV